MNRFDTAIKAVVDARIGKTSISISEIMNFQEGSIIQFDSVTGEPIELYANNTLIGYGDVVVINDNFGLRITKVL